MIKLFCKINGKTAIFESAQFEVSDAIKDLEIDRAKYQITGAILALVPAVVALDIAA